MRTGSASDYTLKRLHRKEKQHRCSPEAGGAESSACHLMLSEAAENFSIVSPKYGLGIWVCLSRKSCMIRGAVSSQGGAVRVPGCGTWGRQKRGKAAAHPLHLSQCVTGRGKVSKGEKPLQPSVPYLQPKHNPKSFLF